MKWTPNELKTWRIGSYAYASIVFSWQIDVARKHFNDVPKVCKRIVGGPAAMMHRDRIDYADVHDSTPFDVLSLHNPFATFTTRGCPNRCSFCIVPDLEPEYIELTEWKHAPIVCDNNILAASRTHLTRVIDSLIPFPSIDFNQGLDASLFDEWRIDELRRLNHVRLRFAFDNINGEQRVVDAIARAHDAGFRDINVYVLIGYHDTPDDARYRLDLMRSLQVYPNPMRYQPLGAKQRNEYVDDNWTERELKHMMRYYSRLRFFERIASTFDDYVAYMGDHDDDNYHGSLFE